jgi:hypothetical protein
MKNKNQIGEIYYKNDSSEKSVNRYGIEDIAVDKVAEAQDANNLVKTQLFDNKLEILLPESFVLMDEGMAKIKYPSTRPTLIYTNKSGKVNVSINRIEKTATEADLNELSKEFSVLFKDAKDFQSNEIVTKNGKKFIIMKVVTDVMGNDTYNEMAVSILDGKLFMVTFISRSDLMDIWGQAGSKIIDSIKVL